jgi:hypothetical protein
VEAQEKQARAFAATVYFLIGGFATTVGGHDVFVAAEVSSRTGGFLLLFGGLVLVAVSIALLMPTKKWSPRRGWAPRAGMYVAAIGVAIGASLIFAQASSPDGGPQSIVLLVTLVAPLVVFARAGWGLARLLALTAAVLALGYLCLRAGDHDVRVVIWVLIVAVSGLASLVLWRTNPAKVAVSVSKVLLGAIGFVSLSAVLGIAQFWYTTQYLPSSELVSLSVESTLRRLGGDGRTDVVELRLIVQNTSPIPAEILGSVYRVSGSDVRPVGRSDLDMKRRLGRPVLYGEAISRYGRNSDWDLVQAGRVFGYGWSLDADEKFSRIALIHVPHGRYDTLRSQAEVLIGKRGALNLDYDSVRLRWLNHAKQHARGIKTIWPIRETSWYRGLTRGDRELRIKWITAADGDRRLGRFPYVRGAITQVGEEASPAEFHDYQDKTAELYGLSNTISTREIPLDIRHHPRSG